MLKKQRNWINLYIKRWQVMGLIIALAVIVDLLTKSIISSTYYIGQEKEIIPHFFTLTYYVNRGAAFSTNVGNTGFLIITTLVSLFVMCWLIKSYKDNNKVVYAMTLAIGGTLGNFYERIFNADHGVTDFLEFKFGSYKFPTFNLADTFIVVGFALAIIFVWKGLKHEKN